MKLVKSLGVTLVCTSLLFAGIASAEDAGHISGSDVEVSSQKSYIINPWNNEKVYYFDEEPSNSNKASSLVESNSEILYEEDARKVLESIKAENEESLGMNYLSIVENEFNNINNLVQPFALQSTLWYRAEFTIVAASFNTFAWDKAAGFLRHSLTNSPAVKSYAAGTPYSNSFSNTTSYTEISIPMALAINKAHSQNKTVVSGTGSNTASANNAGMDWYLSINKYNYSWAAEKESNGKWTVYINISDKYDFETVKNVPSNFPQNLIDTINNHAADAQQVGAITPYYIQLYMKQSNYVPGSYS
ncbi:hypothetical protein ACFSTH_13995 [Paenibacillus yanchengensis]|uniref:Uncharacterized protein n=1 Tax=Paenibacillus yanchengensis TaxID=2035833 RepID=A0ABW4YND4_9BACL